MLLLTLLLTAPQVLALEVFSRKLSTANGLPDDNVRSLVQDEKGFLWMGTPDGLYRFDGYFYTAFRHSATGNMRLLNNNHIEGLYALDGGRRVLVHEQGGVNAVFDVHLGHFIDVDSMQGAALYAQTRARNAEEHLLAPFQDILAGGGNYINDNLGNVVVLDSKGHIWFIDRKTGETIRMSVFDEALFPLVNSQKYKVLTSEEKQLIWVSTNGCGITVYDRRTGQEEHIRQSSGLVSTDYIIDMCMDCQGNVWAADEFHGLVYLSTAGNSLGEVHLLAPESRELRANQVYILCPLQHGRMLVANTRGDVYEADSTLSLQPIMTGTDIHSACTDGEGRLWLGSRRQGLRSPDGTWHKHDDADPHSPASDNIAALLCDADERLWIGCEDAGLDLLEATGGEGFNVGHFLPAHCSPKALLQDHEGRIWAGTKQGLFSFLPAELTGDATAFRQHLTAVDTRQSDVNCLCEDSRQRLWAGTSGNGLYYSDDCGATFHRLTMADGLMSNDIQSLAEADDGIFWIATRQGITCLEPESGRMTYLYNERNPLQNYYADNCVCRLPDGRLAYGTNEGIVVYGGEKPDALHTTLRITGLLVNGIPTDMMEGDSPLSVSPDEADRVTLAHDQNSITVRFSTFNYATPAATRYSYWLEGYDRQWSEVSTYSFASYKNLPPGRYLLHVKAFDNSSSDVAERTLAVIVRQPWWNTWQAWVAYVVAALLMGLVVLRQLLIVYRLRRRISIEQQLTEYKLQFFTNISHEFRTPLTIIRGAMDRIRSTGQVPAQLRQPVSSMQKSTDRLLRLTNQLLEFRKMQNGKLRLALQETDIVAFVKDIYLQFDDIAQNKHISYSFLPAVKTFNMFIDRQHVDKMVYNLLSNAFKYTPAHGSVVLRLRIEDGRMQLSVADTGVGIPREKQGELFQRFMQSTFSGDSIGIGLHLTKALVDVHHGAISFQENQPQGAVFTIELPTDKGVFAAEDFLQTSALEAGGTPQPSGPVYREVMAEPMNDRRVLVVEDDADVADFLNQVLGRYFLVSVATDGAEALKQLETQMPDLVVSDVMMPVMDGFELIRHIRQQPDMQAVPVVLLTALEADEKRLKGIRQGADAYLTKPVDTELLIATCRQLISQRDKLRQRYAEAPATPAPPEIIVEERDKQLLDMMERWLYEHLSNPALSIDDVAQAMGYGRSVFYRKVKALTGQTPADYIRTLRMNRAAELLREETITVAEVAYKVGISEPHYFTKVFKQQFGVSPKKYQQGQKG
ncbi:MAG: response regulator [Bacteroidaceae bacterium]|nr:response regulator [Bacteroidaceae bacterium]